MSLGRLYGQRPDSARTDSRRLADCIRLIHHPRYLRIVLNRQYPKTAGNLTVDFTQGLTIEGLDPEDPEALNG